MTTIPQPEADQLSNPDNDTAPGTSPGERATGGVAGKLLWVDLSEKRSWEEVVPPEVSRAFLGGYGLGAWALYRNLEPGTDPLSADNIFGIVAGTLTGYGTPFSGRSQIVSRSPLTGTWADSNSGGSVASRIRQSGYDALVDIYLATPQAQIIDVVIAESPPLQAQFARRLERRVESP